MPETPGLRLLSRKYCHLCETAQRDLDSLGARYEVIDTDDYPSLQRLYSEMIPVLLHGESEIARAPIDREGLKRALALVGQDGLAQG